MRRLWAAGAAIVMCSTLGGAPVAAQGTEASGVTAAMECGSLYATPIVCTWTASDPRLTGRMTHEWVILELGDNVNTVGWADATVEGPEGNWTGRLYAVWKPARQLFAVLSGDGAYEGWQYVASTIDDETVVGDTEWSGVIYEGELPPYGPLEPPAGHGQAVSANVMEVWATGDESAIEAVYDPEVRMTLDGDELAADRDEITSVIQGAIGIGNTYQQVGPVVEFVDSNGDLYVGTIVEVNGIAHRKGDPVIGFYRVREGKVIRHIFLYGPEY